MKNDLLDRTKMFAISIVQFVQKIPVNSINKVLCNQLLRAGISVGANYRSAQRAKSKSDFIYIVKITEEEADETIYWLELFITSKILQDFSEAENLLKEASELTAILGTIAIKSKESK